MIDKFALIFQTTLSIGILGTVPGHELTHRKKNKFDMFIGNWLLAFSWDCTFAIEHVYGHHRDVCLDEDPASAKRGENIYLFIFFLTMIKKSRSRYGGYFVHLGIVVMFIGFTGQAFNLKKEFGLSVGEQNHIGDVKLELVKLWSEERANHFSWVAELLVSSDDGKIITSLLPEKRIYFHLDPNPDRRQPHSELDIYSTFKRDIYSVFSSLDTENNVAFFQIMINPLVRLVWYGAYILVFGTIIALWPSNRKKLIT